MTDLTPVTDMIWPFHEEFSDFFLGNYLLGEGKYRKVFTNPQRASEEVIKLEKNVYSGEFSNVLEWTVWQRLSAHTEASRWLAPCIAISRSGNILVQKRTEPIRDHEIPEMVPRFLWDAHRRNWGLFEGRPVVHDYAFHCLHDLPRKLKLIKRSEIGTALAD